MPLHISSRLLPCALFFSLTAGAALAQIPAPSGSSLLHHDFNAPSASWHHPSKLAPDATGVEWGSFGSVDVMDSKQASGGLRLSAQGESAAWSDRIAIGPLAVNNAETAMGKLTLAFDLASSRALPIRVIVESFNLKKERTGALATMLYPAASDFYQRFALDFSSMKADGEGKFDPTAPFVGFSIEIAGAYGWPHAVRHELRLDNVHYAKPAYYVSPDGKDSNDGRSEKTAFATPQRAVDVAQAGDIIVLKNGLYEHVKGTPPQTSNAPIARFKRPGTPAAWITLKNYPGHTPTLSAKGHEAINITNTEIATAAKDSSEAAMRLSYIEARGLHIRGNGDTVRQEFPDKIGINYSPLTNSLGINVSGRTNSHPRPRIPGEIVHHIRLADNVVDYVGADGIYIEYVDWLYIENNRIENNCWVTTGYAPAGLSVMGYANFDQTDNVYKMLVSGNRVSGNRLEVKNQPWGDKPKTEFFNGNGMLFDANAETPEKGVYLGRTLIQNNLVFNNGAGGIQLWANHRMDIINNTVYKNGTVLPWGEIGLERSSDVRLINNIIVAQPDHALDTWFVKQMDRGTDRIVRINNLYWSGAKPHVAGIHDVVADPLFVHPSTDAAKADFRLQATSPAIKAGRWEAFSPTIDLQSQARPSAGAPDVGAFQWR